MHSLCKNGNVPTVYVRESTLPHNKRNCFPPYPDHYLNLNTRIHIFNTFVDLHYIVVHKYKDLASGIK